MTRLPRWALVVLLNGLTTGVLALPGDPFCLSFPGNITFTDQMITEIGGTIPCDEHDQFSAGNTLTISGATMEVILINDFVPRAGDTFQVLSFGTLAGTGFAAVDLSQAVLPEPLSWNIDDLFVSGALSVVGPIPEQVPLPIWALPVLALTLLSLIYFRRA